MGARSRRLWLLVKKNWRVKLNQGIPSLLFLLLFPLIIIGFVGVFRPIAKTEEHQSCHTQGYAMPSSGILPWLQGTVCGADPHCFDDIPTERYGTIDSGIEFIGSNLSMPCQLRDLPRTSSESKSVGLMEGYSRLSWSHIYEWIHEWLTPPRVTSRGAADLDAFPDLLDANCSWAANQLNDQFPSFWNIIFPLLEGKIVYAPSNQYTDLIIQQVISMYFDPLANLHSEFSLDLNIPDLIKTVINGTGDIDNAGPWATYISKCAIDPASRFVPVDTNQNAVDVIHDLQNNKTYWASINFEHNDQFANGWPKHFTYTIQQTVLQVPVTYEVQLPANYYTPGNGKENYNQRYIKGGFIILQDMIDHAYTKMQTGSAFTNIGTFLQMIPYPCYLSDNYLAAMAGLMPTLITIGFIYPVAGLTRDMVKDKHTKIRDALALVGADMNLQRLSYIIMPGSLYFVSGLALSGVIWAAFYVHSDWLVIFIWTEFLVYSVLGFIAFMAAISTKPTRASAISGLLFYGTQLAYGPVSAWGVEMSAGVRYLLFLLPGTAMSYGAAQLGRLEILGQGLGISGDLNMGFSTNTKYFPRFCESIFFLFIDGTLGFILAWYIEHLAPGESSSPLPWYFPFTKTYWFGEKSGSSGDSTEKDELSFDYQNEGNTANLEAGVTMKNLTRIHPGGVLAVDDVSVQFYKGQITAYLGRNGAGKSSTLGVLAGLTRATKGGAWIDHFDVVKDREKGHELIGNCPQYNILIDELSPVEHVELYSSLRNPGKKNANIKSETKELLESVGLSDDRSNAPSMFLSGGMKRKLSIALCFIGNPKVIFLDEPTAGVDPEARRAIWKLLQTYHGSKPGITMILCTHHLDEAELLGDRIVVIDGGKIKCAGSNLWMKNTFGHGYVLTISHEGATFDSDQVLALFEGCSIQTSALSNTGANEIEVNIPYAFVNSPEFVVALETLDRLKTKLGVKSYGVRDTTLEEIFISLTDEPNDDYQDSAAKHSYSNKVADSGDESSISSASGVQSSASSPISSTESLEGSALFFQQFKGIMVKRIRVSSRDWKSAISQLLLPVVFVLMALSFTLIVPSFTEFNTLELTPWLYDRVQSFSSLENSEQVFSDVNDALQAKPGWGTLCVPNYQVGTWPYGVLYECDSGDSSYWADPSSEYRVQNESRYQTAQLGQTVNDCTCPKAGPIPSHNSKAFEYCPDGVGSYKLSAADTPYQILQMDTTDTEIAPWLEKTQPDFLSERQGGLAIGVTQQAFEPDGATPLSTTYLNPNNARVWYSTQVFHAVPSYLNVFSNAQYRASLNDTANAENYAISVFNLPLQETSEDQVNASVLTQLIVDTLLALSVIFALAFLPANFIVLLVDENEVGAKHLQLVAGLQQWPFWLANWTWDFALYAMAAILTFLCFLAFQEESFVGESTWLTFILLLVFFGWAVIPMEYPFYRLFRQSGSAYVGMLAFNVVLGVGFCAMIFTLQFLAEDNPTIEQVYDILSWALLVIPHFAFGQGMISMGYYYAQYQARSVYLNVEAPNLLEFNKVGKNILFLFLEGIILIIAVVYWEGYLESTRLPELENPEYVEDSREDEDVKKEREEVDDAGMGDGATDMLVVNSLNKTFQRPAVEKKQKLDNSVCCKGGCCSCCTCCCREEQITMTAVQSLSFKVKPGECFGLLGVNGAGKTTTFRMITGEMSPNFGRVEVNGISMFENPNDARKILGYCPQSDALNVLLTSKEHLYLYARIRGTPENEIESLVNDSLNRFGLAGKWANRRAGNLSGGGKRRLNAAVAFSGAPKLVLLDEPTAGLDPAARNQVWTKVRSLANEGTSLVLTSHSVSECESVCNRLGIMVGGKFCCVGSPQQIKDKFGKGYVVTARLESGESDEKINGFITSSFSDARVIERQSNILKYRIGEKDTCNISSIIGVLQTAKKNGLTRDYSLAQASLDDVFVQFARDERDRQMAEKSDTVSLIIE